MRKVDTRVFFSLSSTLLCAVLYADVQGFLMHRWMSGVLRQGR